MRISRFELARKPVPCFLPGKCLRDAFPVPVELIPAPAPVAVVVAMALSLSRSPRRCQIGDASRAFQKINWGLYSLPCMHKNRCEVYSCISRHPHRTRFCGKTVPQLRSCHITTSWSPMLKS